MSADVARRLTGRVVRGIRHMAVALALLSLSGLLLCSLVATAEARAEDGDLQTIRLSAAASAGATSGSWRWLSPRPQGNDLFDVCFVDRLRGWAVGNGSTILRTTDGGVHWRAQRRGIDRGAFRALAFADRRRGVAVGEDGVIVRTVDAGAHWDHVRSRTGNDLVSVAHIRCAAYLAVGGAGTLLRSANGGRSWRALESPYGGHLIRAAFADGRVGWVVGTELTILRTSDHGRTWKLQHQGDEGFLLGVVAVSRRECWAVGCGDNEGGTAIILHTRDGGRTWRTRRLPRKLFPLADMVFTGRRVACAVSSNGAILRTTDRCATWRVVRKANGTCLESITSRGRGRLVAVGHAGTILAGADGGRRWRSRNARPLRQAEDVDFVTARAGWAAARGRIMASTDGGVRWTRVDADSRASDEWDAIEMVDGTHGCAVGQDGDADMGDEAIIARMGAGGKWRTVLRHGYPPLNDVDLADAEVGWTVGDSGTILRTTDGGATWQPQDAGYAGFLGAVCALDRSRVWAAGAHGTILRTSDGGLHWTQVTTPTDKHLFAITFADELHGWAGGADETILRTADGGESWSVAQTGVSEAAVNRLCFVSPTTGWAAAGGYRAVLYTEDGGATWQPSGLHLPVRLDIPAMLTGVDFVSSDRGWVVGSGGLLTTTTGGR